MKFKGWYSFGVATICHLQPGFLLALAPDTFLRIRRSNFCRHLIGSQHHAARAPAVFFYLLSLMLWQLQYQQVNIGTNADRPVGDPEKDIATAFKVRTGFVNCKSWSYSQRMSKHSCAHQVLVSHWTPIVFTRLVWIPMILKSPIKQSTKMDKHGVFSHHITRKCPVFIHLDTFKSSMVHFTLAPEDAPSLYKGFSCAKPLCAAKRPACWCGITRNKNRGLGWI